MENSESSKSIEAKIATPVNSRPAIRFPGVGIAVLFGAFFVMLIILSVIAELIMTHVGMSTKLLRVTVLFQDIFVFILPAIAAAMVVTRLPASLLMLNVKPRLMPLLMALVVMVTSIPAMDWIVNLNQNIHFPESMSRFEEIFRSFENEASGTIENIAGGTSVGDLILSILTIGLMTGLAEELFFRGALQNLFFSTRMKKHLAVWLVAIIFSFMHFQFFGFVPRVLLGAYFGYLIWWTGSVWVPVIAHAFNNSLVVILGWISERSLSAEAEAEALETAAGSDWVTIVLSVAVTAFGIVILRRISLRQRR